MSDEAEEEASITRSTLIAALATRGITLASTTYTPTGLLSCMCEHADRVNLRIVEASSVTDYLSRWYKRERHSSTLQATYETELQSAGYVNTSHYDNVTGAWIYWPSVPADYWETTPEVREWRGLVELLCVYADKDSLADVFCIPNLLDIENVEMYD